MGTRVKKRNINLYPSKIGEHRKEEIFDLENARRMYLPLGCSEENIDTAIFQLFDGETNDRSDGAYNKSLQLISKTTKDAKPVPIISIISNEVHAEQIRTWESSDDRGNITLPFISFNRKSNVTLAKDPRNGYIQPGQIPYQYIKIPYAVNGVINYEHYRVPLPTIIEITYEIKLYTRYIEDINTMDSNINNFFSSIQGYIVVNGVFQDLRLKSSSLTMPTKEGGAERYLVGTYEIEVNGKIRDENSYTNVSGIRNVNLNVIPPEVAQKLKYEQE